MYLQSHLKLLHKTKQNILHVSLSIQRPEEKKLLNNKTNQNKTFYMWDQAFSGQMRKSLSTKLPPPPKKQDFFYMWV